MFPYFSFRKYVAVTSHEQRESYKNDFNAEYDEYRALHAQVESVLNRFMKFSEQRKLLSPGSKERQVKKGEPVCFAALFHESPLPDQAESLEQLSVKFC